HPAEHAFLDHLLGDLIELAVAPLQADLDHLVGMLRRERPEFENLLRRKDERFFAEHVLARQDCRFGDLEVLVKGHCDINGIDILPRQQLTIIVVAFGVAADRRYAFLEVLGIDVAHGRAAPGVDLAQMPQELLAAAAGADEPVVDGAVGGLALASEFWEGHGRRCGQAHSSRDEVSSVQILVIWHVAHLLLSSLSRRPAAGQYLDSKSDVEATSDCRLAFPPSAPFSPRRSCQSMTAGRSSARRRRGLCYRRPYFHLE